MFNIFRKRTLLTSVSSLILASIGVHAFGQVPPNAPDVRMDESEETGNWLDNIIVTARKVEESAQDIPIAISAISAETLKSRGVENITDIQYQVPSLIFSNTATSSFTPLVSLRGQTQSTISLTVDPSVGTYFDGVYVSGTGGLIGNSLLDLERVEVLKGPQGTLFGRNTTGGAISVISKRPTDEFEAEIGAKVGNYNAYGLHGIVNIPVIEDKLAIRLVGSYSERDGYGYDANRGVNVGDQKLTSGRATVLFTPNEAFEAILRADFTNGEDTGTLLFPAYIDPAVAGPTLADASIELTGANTAAGRALATTRFLELTRLDRLQVRYNSDPFNEVDLENYSLTMSYDFGAFEIKSITAMREAHDRRLFEVDTSDIANFNSLTIVNRDLFTQELQLTGQAFDDRLSYTFGGFYYDLDGTESGTSFQFANLTNGRATTNSVKFQGESASTYGQFTYAVTPKFNLTAGLRYTWESKTYDSFSGRVSNSSPFSCLLPTSLNPDLVNCSLVRSNSEDNISYTLAADYTVRDGMMFYARTARGFKSGGFNQRVTGSNPLSGSSYNPEEITDYEVGFKSDLYDNRLRLNLAYYHSDYSNVQRQTAACDSTGVSCTTVLRNAAQATIDGIEAELTFVPVDGLKFLATAAYTNPEYAAYSVNGIDNRGERFLEVPDLTYSLSVGYTLPTSWGDTVFQMDWTWRDEMDMAPQDRPGGLRTSGGVVTANGRGTPDDLRIQPSYGLLNAMIAIQLDKPNVEFRVFAKNILDERYFSHMIGNVNAGLGLASATVGAPATYGMGVRFKF